MSSGYFAPPPSVLIGLRGAEETLVIGYMLMVNHQTKPVIWDQLVNSSKDEDQNIDMPKDFRYFSNPLPPPRTNEG